MNPVLVPLAFLPGGIGPGEMLVVGIIAVLLFGSKLPEIARSAGKSLTEFKKGMHGFESEMKNVVYDDVDSPSTRQMTYQPDHYETPAPAFVPPAAADTAKADAADPTDSVPNANADENAAKA
ncbi:Sec-independent protein translocase protein TatAy [Pirellulimonas nuda]|uniref:Sec-independent protein translocase protein TatA n=1 Tax=Pirellulimonas nuda TaxID=2528009 RepID=A0A518D920_9BACT|nr:twin-arginine translocase TatA/TatE family subunit [Pirellulimonas nuda]QDU87973.1 Sec-independent protein translocase protein TatAy [Pirellulimonas nuda]